MELALLVYAISVLGSLAPTLAVLLFMAIAAMAISAIAMCTWAFDGTEYSWNLNKDGSLKEGIKRARDLTQRIFKWSAITSIALAFVIVIVPSQKTAWIMVGAYATQKVAEDPRTVELGGKVMTVINQQLDQLIEDGTKKATKKAEEVVDKVTK